MERVLPSRPTPRQRCHRESPFGNDTRHSPLADNDHRSVIWKLMSFTFAMITLPIGTYFFTVNFVFKGMWFKWRGN
jgi:hypothetical protein